MTGPGLSGPLYQFTPTFDYAILGPIELEPGPFAEVVFFHKRSRTLLVTDSVLSVPEDPSAIVQLDPYPLLFHAKDDAFAVVKDTETNRRKGWQRISLFGSYFRPSAIEVIPWGQAFRDALKAADRSKQAYFGLFPFKWEDWKQSFDTLRSDGRLFVAPILQTLILNRAPRETIDWADKISSWNFQRIISCHFDSPVKADPHQFRQAFAFLENQPVDTLPQEDFELLRTIDQQLNRRGIIPPPLG